MKYKAFWDKSEDVLLCLRNIAIGYNYTKEKELSAPNRIIMLLQKSI